MKLRTIISILLIVLIISIGSTAAYTVSAANADFEIGSIKFKAEVEGYNIAFYRINSDGSLSDAGKMPLDDAAEDFQNNEIKYEVYGNEVVAIAVIGDKQMAFDWYYDSAAGKFRYPREDDDLKYDYYKTTFSLKGVKFYAEIEQDHLDEANDFPIYLTISILGGSDTNLKDIIVNKPGPVGTTAGSAYVHEVRNYFEVSGDELIITSEIGENKSYTFDRNTNKFAEYGALSDSSGEVTEQMLYDKFEREYGNIFYFDYGDHNKDGKPDAYAHTTKAGTVDCYFVTADDIIYAGNVGDTQGSNEYEYFECKGYQFRANYRFRSPVAYFTGSISIDRIEKDGTLTPCNTGETVIYDYWSSDREPYYKSYMTEDEACEISSFLKSNNDGISLTVYDFENNIVGVTTNYSYEPSTNKFVKKGSSKSNSGSDALDIKERDTITITGSVKYVTAGNGINISHPPVIVLDNPLKVRYHVSMDDMVVSEGKMETFKEIQFSCDSEYKEGQRLSVTGEVMYAHTAYHATNIVLVDCSAEILENDTVNTSVATTTTAKISSELSAERSTTAISAKAADDDFDFDIKETPDVSYEKSNSVIDAF
ncbi:MAG: DUF4431 domain-containing protein, partial [Ruminococcus sp.]